MSVAHARAERVGRLRATANEMGIGKCGALIVQANLLLFQAMRLSAAPTGGFLGSPDPCSATTLSPSQTFVGPAMCVKRVGGASCYNVERVTTQKMDGALPSRPCSP
jgi:hypothetical protein